MEQIVKLKCYISYFGISTDIEIGQPILQIMQYIWPKHYPVYVKQPQSSWESIYD